MAFIILTTEMGAREHTTASVSPCGLGKALCNRHCSPRYEKYQRSGATSHSVCPSPDAACSSSCCNNTSSRTANAVCMSISPKELVDLSDLASIIKKGKLTGLPTSLNGVVRMVCATVFSGEAYRWSGFPSRLLIVGVWHSPIMRSGLFLRLLRSRFIFVV